LVNSFRFFRFEGIDRAPSKAQQAGICRSLASLIPEDI
jgi:hypothetical protein